MNIVKARKYFYLFSAVLVVLSFASFLFFGLNFGTDFKGDALLDIEYSAPVSAEAVRGDFQTLNLGDVKISIQGDRRFSLRTKYLTQDEHELVLGALKREGEFEEKNFISTGPSIGAQLRRNAILAIIFALVAIILYITFAFRKVSKPISSWIYGSIAVIALFHDIIIPTGLFSLLRFEIDSLFITALLTVFGFSVHDTIVVFDRVRENLRRDVRGKFEDIVERSLRETIGRSINTSLTTLFSLLAVYFFGGPSTQHLALALIAGIVVGTYSSIFIASTLLVTVAKRKGY